MKRKSKILFFVTFLLFSAELIFIVVNFFIIVIILNDVVVLQEIIIGSTIIPELASKFLFSGLLIFLELTLVFSAIIMWLNYKELRSF